MAEEYRAVSCSGAIRVYQKTGNQKTGRRLNRGLVNLRIDES
jgi:hypothetical protein